MSVKRIREDSLKELQKRKSVVELQKENEELKNTVTALEKQLNETQMALCDVYETVIASQTQEEA